jgi:shikimate dehydrogenase
MIAAVIGSPISHSLSPAIHNAAFVASGRDAHYVGIDCESEGIASVFQSLLTQDLLGVSVTMPLKNDIIAHLHVLDPDASLLQAVNCVSVSDGRLVGHNTDGDGCCDALEQQGGAVLVGAHVAVLGAGGTARSVALSLARRGARISVINRTQSHAEDLVLMVQSAVDGADIRIADASAITNAQVLINTTSVGMNSEDLPIDPVILHSGLTVLDAVYSPLNTHLLRHASAVGASVVDGLWMLIQQARRQQLLWCGVTPAAEPMRLAAEQELERRPK